MQDPHADMKLLNQTFDKLVDKAKKIRLAYSMQNPWMLTYMTKAEEDRGSDDSRISYKEYKELLPGKWFSDRSVKKVLKEGKEELMIWQMQPEGRKARPCGVRQKKRRYIQI